jgi:tellurite resistance protein TerC
VATNIWFWVIFNLFVVGMLALDLGVFHRHSHKVSVKEAAIWSAVWISLALLFNVGLYIFEGRTIALEFLGGYLLEKSLSVDNIFVFVLIFSYFNVPAIYQHRVLFWGILTALVLRGVMIIVGAQLVSQFEFLITIFGAFLVFTGIRMAFQTEGEIDTESSPVIRALRRVMPVTTQYHGEKFTIIQNGQRFATPLLVVLLLVETSDVIFAVDSIPAVFGITRDPFIVYTSNIFAILGLRSLYFALAGVMHRFVYLKPGLALVLTFVGIKMMLGHTPWKIDTLVALGVVGSILTGAIVLSWWKTKQDPVAAAALGAQPPLDIKVEDAEPVSAEEPAEPAVLR